jgi:cobalt-zinc-cadmium efflux system membrane fusion protein
VRAKVSFPALPGQDFEGTVAVVGRHVESQSRTVPIRIDLKNKQNLLRPGMSATATLPVGDTVVVDGAFLLRAQVEKSEADHDAH